MPLNQFFRQDVDTERDLYEDLIIESIQFYGVEVYYIPREIIGESPILQDDLAARFDDAYKIEAYIENAEGFEGENDIFTKFGIELRDQASFIIARKRWREAVGSWMDGPNYRPREGDLVYLPLSESLFQIMHVETESPFYQLAQLPLFRLRAELFDYSSEDFDTGIPDIDAVEDHARKTVLKMKTPTGDFIRGESIMVDGNIVAEVLDWNSPAQELAVIHAVREFAAGDRVEGDLSETTGEVGSAFVPDDNSSQNEMLNDFGGALDYVVFDETNPFGDPR